MVDRKIVIVGFMGSGKTCVGREVALLLHRPFVDLDERITRDNGRSPREIIEQDGEVSFRQLETQALENVLAVNDAPVIAVGGGAWGVERNRQMINGQGVFTVWLDAPFALCWQRIESGSERRPLAPSREAAERLFLARRPTYKLAETRIPISGEADPQAIAAQIAAAFLSSFS